MRCSSLSAHFCGQALIGCRSENTVKVAILNFFFLIRTYQSNTLDSTEMVAERPILRLIVSSSPCIDPCWNTAVVNAAVHLGKPEK